MAEAVQLAESGGADTIHVDVMDGVYCNNLTFGPGMVEAIKKECTLKVEVHFELVGVEHFIPMFIQSGADSISFQLDACPNPIHALKMIREAGLKAGIGFGPSYTIERLPYLLHLVDSITLMSVEPGYGGQPFEESIFEKVKVAKEYMEKTGVFVPIEVDGGVNLSTGKRLVEAGADTLIVGSYIFNSDNIKGRVEALKKL